MDENLYEIEKMFLDSDNDFDLQIGLGGIVQNQNRYFNVSEEFKQYVKRFKQETRALNYQLKDMETAEDRNMILNSVIDHAIKKGFEMGGKDSLVGLNIMHPEQNPNYGPILIPFSRKEVLTANKVINTLSGVVQSNEFFAIDNNITIQVTSIPAEMTKKR